MAELQICFAKLIGTEGFDFFVELHDRERLGLCGSRRGRGSGAGSGIIGGSCRAVGIRIDGDHLDTGDHVHAVLKEAPGDDEAEWENGYEEEPQ